MDLSTPDETQLYPILNSKQIRSIILPSVLFRDPPPPETRGGGSSKSAKTLKNPKKYNKTQKNRRLRGGPNFLSQISPKQGVSYKI